MIGRPPVALPSLSVLVPACNEAEVIEPAMRSLLALQYPCMEVIAVEDRSTDATGEILRRLAAHDPRLRVISVRSLPAGWLGKNYALHRASQEARGEWLLFTDADVVFAPAAMQRAVEHAVRRGIDHLVVSPRFEAHGFWEKLFVSYFSLMFSLRVRPWEVADPRKRAYVGLGAFNLVKAGTYHRFGGHEALKMEVCDDTKLGKLVKQTGGRQEIALGRQICSVRWVVGLRGAIHGLEKNAFAGFEFSLPAMLGSVALLGLTALYPLAALIAPGAATRWLGAGAIAAMVIGAAGMRRVTDASPLYGLAYPMAALVLIYTIMRSTLRAFRRGGIEWRGTVYPFDELRRGVV